MSTLITDAMSHWKTTVNGVLAFLMTSGAVVVAFTATIPGHKAATITTGITIVLALCRAWVGLLQQDAGQTPAILPGSTTPQSVPSHEVPNDPAAVAVVKQ